MTTNIAVVGSRRGQLDDGGSNGDRRGKERVVVISSFLCCAYLLRLAWYLTGASCLSKYPSVSTVDSQAATVRSWQAKKQQDTVEEEGRLIASVSTTTDGQSGAGGVIAAASLNIHDLTHLMSGPNACLSNSFEPNVSIFKLDSRRKIRKIMRDCTVCIVVRLCLI